MTRAQAFARALRIDKRSRQLGREAASIGLPWRCPDDADMLSYSLGYADGKTEHMCRCGEPAPPERLQ